MYKIFAEHVTTIPDKSVIMGHHVLERPCLIMFFRLDYLYFMKSRLYSLFNNINVSIRGVCIDKDRFFRDSTNYVQSSLLRKIQIVKVA